MNIIKPFYEFKEKISKRFKDLSVEEKIQKIPNSWSTINYAGLNTAERIELGILTTLFFESFTKKYRKIANLNDLLFNLKIDPHWEFLLAAAKNIQIDRIDYIGDSFGTMAKGIKVNHLENAGKYGFLGSKDCFVNYLNYAARDFADLSENFRFNTINKLEEYGFTFSKNAKGDYLREANEQFGAGSKKLEINHIHDLKKLGFHNSLNAKINKLDRAGYDFGMFSKNLIVKDAGMLDDCAFTNSLNGKISKLSCSDGGLGFLSKGLNIGEWNHGVCFDLFGSKNATIKSLLFEKRPEWKFYTLNLKLENKNDRQK